MKTTPTFRARTLIALLLLLAMLLCLAGCDRGGDTPPSTAGGDVTAAPATDAPTDPATDAPTDPVTDTPTDPASAQPTEPETELVYDLTVTYQTTEGTVLAREYLRAGDPLTVPDAPAASAGYRFVGWQRAADGQTYAYEEMIAFRPEADETFTSAYERIAYTVQFRDEDGERVAPNQTVLHGDRLSSVPDAPAREGYTFTGWQWGGSVYNSYMLSRLPITSSGSFVTVYTRIIPTYTVTFLDTSGNTIGTASVKEGQNATIPNAGSGYFYAPTVAGATEYIRGDTTVTLTKLSSSAYTSTSISMKADSRTGYTTNVYNIRSYALVFTAVDEYTQFSANCAGEIIAWLSANEGITDGTMTFAVLVDGEEVNRFTLGPGYGANTRLCCVPSGTHTIRLVVVETTGIQWGDGGWMGINCSVVLYNRKR
ncbi:MAG: InlB B-repeat-containing protein [Clostridia bacterium]|nr:InlB B-repeat-containing protein [Clostridia bacterium]